MTSKREQDLLALIEAQDRMIVTLQAILANLNRLARLLHDGQESNLP